MNSVKWPCSPWLLRAPTWCSEGHGFDSCWGLRVFLCLALVLCWSVHFSLFQLEEQVPYFFSNLQRSICQGSNFFNYPIKEIIAQALNSFPTNGMPSDGTIWNFSTTSRQKLNYKCWRYRSDNRELKHRRFWATDINRKSRLLLFDAYYTLFIQKVML